MVLDMVSYNLFQKLKDESKEEFKKKHKEFGVQELKETLKTEFEKSKISQKDL